jgi:hypothetical protein
MPTSTANADQQKKLHPPFAYPDPERRAMQQVSGDAPEEAAETLPPIERFVDDLPLIDEFLLELQSPAHADQSTPTSQEVTSMPVAETAMDSEGWAAADWQSYDWGGLASLGAPAPEAAEAHAAWSTTNWEAGRGGPSDRAIHLREDDVAAALDEIARRIRSGELSLQQFRGSPPEAALAAAFASLLRPKG